MELSLDPANFDPTCLLVSAWLIVALILCMAYLLVTSRHDDEPHE